MRKKLRHAEGLRLAAEIGENDFAIAAKFPDDLAASAAGRSEFFGGGDDGNGVEAARAFGNGFEDGGAFGADGESVGGIFHVAAGENLAGLRAQRRTNFEIGERGVRVLANSARGGDKFGVIGSHDATIIAQMEWKMESAGAGSVPERC